MNSKRLEFHKKRISNFLDEDVSDWKFPEYYGVLKDHGWELCGWTERYPVGTIRVMGARYLGGGNLEAQADGTGSSPEEAMAELLFRALTKG